MAPHAAAAVETPRQDEPSPAYAVLHEPAAGGPRVRRVPLSPRSPRPPPSNAVATARFTWWSFVPLVLADAFAQTANLYFLLVGVLQAVPSVSPTGGVPTQLVPLAAVVLVDAAFAALEDARRHRDDARANAASTHLLRASSRRFERAQWRDIAVGDVVRLANHETVPADAVVLAVDAPTRGVCFVETKSLDGESNLKPREAPKATRHLFIGEDRDAMDAVMTMDGYVETEPPNTDVHAFAGTLVYTEVGTTSETPRVEPLALQHALLRGAKVRNAKAVYALVVATGADCKAVRGAASERFPPKVSSLDGVTNRQVRVVVALLVLVCLVGAAADNSPLAARLFVGDTSVPESFAYYLTILCDLVPITLYVTITVVRAFQAFFMAHDLALYDAASDTPLAVRSMQLNEQLGQITHVFADKTGTLTRNDMVLRKCSVRGAAYDALDGTLATAWGDGRHAKAFFTHLALCHSVLIEPRASGGDRKEDEEVVYSAASPDEQALVSGARRHGGVAFAGRTAEHVALHMADGERALYRVLDVVAFSSTRKRMTVVVQKQRGGGEDGDDGDDGSDSNAVLVLTKGSESVVFGRLAASTQASEQLRDATHAHVTAFAHEGLRTLVFASKAMPHDEYAAFHARLQRARADLRQVDAQQRGLANDIDALHDELESGLALLGATAIEDRLQDGVPETIAKLRAADVAVWMLTGDMQETAVNIARSCHLLDDAMQCHVVRGNSSDGHDDRESVLRQLDDIYQCIAAKAEDEAGGHALVVDGASLNVVLRSTAAEEKVEEEENARLLRVALRCRAVVACRASPLQKAQLVDLVKRNVRDAHTLAIGDGANDVPMLCMAHVGVGIAGQEGRQAVNSSDYAIAQFRFLQPLLFVHGRWNYNRVAGLIGYTFYKNMVYSLSLFWFCLTPSSYSGAMLYSPMIQQFYNLVFTVLPIALFAIQDRDLPSKQTALDHPALYARDARRSVEFTQRSFWTWVALAVIDSVALFLVVLAASFGVMRHGETIELTVLWSLAWTIMVSLVTARFCLLVHSWTVIEVAGVVFSLGSMVGVQILFDAVTWGGEDFNTYAFPWLLARPQLWLGIGLALVGILLKDVAYAAYCRRFHPQLIDLVRERGKGKQNATAKVSLLEPEDLEVGVEDLS